MSADGSVGAEQIAKAMIDKPSSRASRRGANPAAQAVKSWARSSFRTTETVALRKTIAGLEEQLELRSRAFRAEEAALQVEKRLSEQDQALQAAKQRVVELERLAKERLSRPGIRRSAEPPPATA